MTNDGDLMQHLLHPSHEVNKTYHVSVYGSVGGAARRLEALRDLEGEAIRPAQVEVLRQTGQTAELAVTIHEGKNRQVRRMCAACGLSVKRLRRVREHTLELGDLPAGQWRYLTEAEVTALKQA
jgi:23S rRNA pseudouridine2605 synthase